MPKYWLHCVRSNSDTLALSFQVELNDDARHIVWEPREPAPLPLPLVDIVATNPLPLVDTLATNNHKDMVEMESDVKVSCKGVFDCALDLE